MNEDFALLLTPANARRLLRFSQCCDIVAGEDLIEIAARDTISEEEFDSFVCPYTETKQTITQFLLDNNLRGIIQQDYHPEFNEIALMNAVRIRQPAFVTVFTNREKVWKNAAQACLRVDTDVTFHRPYSLTGEQIDKRRSGVLIIDHDVEMPHNLRAFASEFASTLYFVAFSGWNATPWPLAAKMMNPTMPNPLYPRMVNETSEAYKKPLYLFAPLYGVCIFPELMGVDQLEYLDDMYLHRQLQRVKEILSKV